MQCLRIDLHALLLRVDRRLYLRLVLDVWSLHTILIEVWLILEVVLSLAWLLDGLRRVHVLKLLLIKWHLASKRILLIKGVAAHIGLLRIGLRVHHRVLYLLAKVVLDSGGPTLCQRILRHLLNIQHILHLIGRLLAGLALLLSLDLLRALQRVFGFQRWIIILDLGGRSLILLPTVVDGQNWVLY